ncbi:MAG: slipin family protein [Bdellovibrionales bacterium]|nr:slipin family protein [Bdellovibrionales bacterium]
MGTVLLLMFLGSVVYSGIRIIAEYERGVVFRLGRIIGIKDPGLRFLIPFVDRMIKVGMRTITMDIPTQDVITSDNVSIKVNAVVYFQVMDPEKAILKVEDYFFATSQLSQTTLRSVVGQFSLDKLLAERDIINMKLQDILDESTNKWGIKVEMVEVKHIDLPKEMQRAMAREAEAERERRAKVISAEGELQRSEKLREASNILSESPSALQLAYLQSLNEVAGDKTNTIIFPLPLDMLGAFEGLLGKKKE